MKTRICIFDDSKHIRESFDLLLDGLPEMELVGSFPDYSHLESRIKDCRPDIVIMDIEIPPDNGIAAVKTLRPLFPDLPVIMFTVFEQSDKIFDSICAGANGYLLKKSTPESILTALKDIIEGGSAMSPSVAKKVLERFQNDNPSGSEDYSLTPREKEILKLLTQGLSYKMVADKSNISFETVRTHIKNIYGKLHVSSMSEAVIKAIKENIV